MSLPSSIVDDVAAEADERGISFSAVVAERLARRGRKLSFAGVIDGEPDLSQKLEEFFREQDSARQ